MLSPAEQVVLLDESGAAVGVADKQAVHSAATPLHLAFSCYIVDVAGRVLLTRRADSKRTWPGVWTNSCCGHPGPGEAIDDGVVRRIGEELGMTVTGLDLVLPGFRYRAEQDGVVENEMCPVFRAVAATPPVPEPAEVADTRWVPWAHLRRRAQRRPSTLSPWCVDQVEQLDRLGPSPHDWPVGARSVLPSAAR